MPVRRKRIGQETEQATKRPKRCEPATNPMSRRSKGQRRRRDREKEERSVPLPVEALAWPVPEHGSAGEPGSAPPLLRVSSSSELRRSEAQHQRRHTERSSSSQLAPVFPATSSRIALDLTGDFAPQYLGTFTDRCDACGALHWVHERPKARRAGLLAYSSCCRSGAVDLPGIFDAPDELKRFFNGSTTYGHRFLQDLRMYNNMFSFTSLGTNEKHLSPRGSGIFTFKIQGALHHRIGSMFPDDPSRPKFAQIYFHDPDPAAMAAARMAQFHGRPDEDTVVNVQAIILATNPFARVFCTARQRLEQESQQDQAFLRIHNEAVAQGRDPRTYHRPTADEVAAIVVGSEDDINATSADRHLLVKTKQDKLQYVSSLHSAYLPLRYPMLIPWGMPGWHKSIPLVREALPAEDSNENVEEPQEPRPSRKKMNCTQGDFYAYHLQERGSFSTLLRGRRLLQEFVVDAWCQIESSRLGWYRRNQSKVLRMTTQDALFGATAAGASPNQVGRRVVLPGKFINGPKFWSNLYHDAMAIVRSYGPPDLFITMTTNPAWQEIQENLLSGQSANDRPDLVARVFNGKLKYLQDLLLQQGVFGPAVAMVRTTEFQKRGLPHAHILVILDKDHRPSGPADYDRIVSAEIPDPAIQPALHDIVMGSMIHGPCDNSQACMRPETSRARLPGRCSKGYPRPFLQDTIEGVDGYPQYRRRNDGRVYYRRTDRQKAFPIDNRHVVPYNPWLSLALNAHINVEVASSISSVKYLYKYIYKGPDRVTITLADGSQIEREDEIKTYLDARYVSATEACTRIYEFGLHSRSPSVESLPVHLPDGQALIFDEDASSESIAAQGLQDTKLTAFFKKCKADPDLTKHLTYADFPKKYTWKPRLKIWTKRRGKASVGRVDYVHSLSDDRYFLRMLLHTVPGPHSFQDLLRVNGVPHATFRAACQALGLLSDDKEWSYCLQEAGAVQRAQAVRELFCIILCHNLVGNPRALFDTHYGILSDDCARKLQLIGIEHPPSDRTRSLCLALLAQTLFQLPGERTLSDFGLDSPTPRYADDILAVQDPSIRDRTRDVREQAQVRDRAVSMFTEEQRRVFDLVTSSVRNREGRMFFLDGPGGTGKTFVENGIMAACRADRNKVVAVASSGIAALLLHGGRTAHSTFKIPIDGLGTESMCGITRDGKDGKALMETDLIVWDEAPMMHRLGVEAVDRTLRDLRSCDRAFGGITILFSGE